MLWIKSSVVSPVSKFYYHLYLFINDCDVFCLLQDVAKFDMSKVRMYLHFHNFYSTHFHEVIFTKRSYVFLCDKK